MRSQGGTSQRIWMALQNRRGQEYEFEKNHFDLVWNNLFFHNLWRVQSERLQISGFYLPQLKSQKGTIGLVTNVSHVPF